MLHTRYFAGFADVANSAQEGRQDVDRSRGEEKAGGGNEDRGGVTVVSGALYWLSALDWVGILHSLLHVTEVG